MPTYNTRKELKASFKKQPIESLLFGAIITGVCTARCGLKGTLINVEEIVDDALDIYYELRTHQHMDKYGLAYYDRD